MEKISVVIPAYDKHDVTVAHVREGMRTSVMPHEIIVVNDGGHPNLKDKLKKLKPACSLIYARIEQDILWNYNGACNLGAWIATGDYLMFEDNDNIPTKTVYAEMLELFKSNPNIGMMTGSKRMDIEQKDLCKPAEQWVQKGKRGPNQGTHMIKRSIYLETKGQDERFCGRYGWMVYDRDAKLRRITQITKKGHFWYVTDAQSNLERRMHPTNYNLYRKNAREDILQSPEGILNFTYEIHRYN